MAASANPSGNNQEGSSAAQKVSSSSAAETNGAAENSVDNGGNTTVDNSQTISSLRHNPGISVDWTHEEQSLLEDLLAKYASEPTIVRYAKIAMKMKDKTVRDVALCCRWMTKKVNGKRRKEDHSSRKSKDKKEKTTYSSVKSSSHLNVHPNGLSYDPPPMMPIDTDDGISYKAIGGVSGYLLEQNAQMFNQVSSNFSAFVEIRETGDLFAPPMDSARVARDLSSCDGRLTLEGFSVAAQAFIDNWKRHNQSFPPWSWVPLINRSRLVSNKEEGYLSLEKIFILSSLEESQEEESLNVETDSFEKEESFDHTILVVQNVENEAHYYDFHIVYSASYEVPVLYFRGYYSGGQLLDLDVIKKDLPSCSVSLLLESKWTFITQEEHPYLNRPWFKLHPCGTDEWIKLLSQTSSYVRSQIPVEIYLVSWFSVVGQVVGLRIPLEMLN